MTPDEVLGILFSNITLPGNTFNTHPLQEAMNNPAYATAAH